MMPGLEITGLVGIANTYIRHRADMINGLSLPPGQRHLPSGLSHLEPRPEAIKVPEHYQASAEMWILSHYARELACTLGKLSHNGKQLRLIEVDCGSMQKSLFLIQALRGLEIPFTYYMVDTSRQALQTFQDEHPEELGIHLVWGEAAHFLKEQQYSKNTVDVIINLGGNVGSGCPDASINMLRTSLPNGGVYLVSWNSLEVGRSRLLQAYNDASGVTRTHVMNTISQANCLYGGDLDPRDFDYAPYLTEDGSVIMRVRAKGAITAHFSRLMLMSGYSYFQNLRINFDPDESILISTSQNWQPSQFKSWLCGKHGLTITQEYASPGNEVYLTLANIPPLRAA